MRGLLRGSAAVEVFAVEDTSAQVVWRAARPGVVRLEVDGRSASVEGDGGPGSLTIDGLAPGTATKARLLRPGHGRRELELRTSSRPPGAMTSRIATVGDLHLGARVFGHLGTITERPPTIEAAAVRCARAALAEAVAWGAELIVVKGDVTSSGRRLQWQQAAALFAEVPVPVVVVPGNHDTAFNRTTEPRLAAAELGLHVVGSVETVDLPGIRVVMADTTVPGRSKGRLAHRHDQVVEAAADAEAALVVLHHQLELLPELPLWPPGIRRPEADAFLDDLAAAQPAALVTSGHTHRHRRRAHGPLTLTTVGSTKDYPGVWAGYAVHEGGIRQVVRRVADPACLRWTETTRRAAAGLWGHLAPGTLDDRCFSLTWPPR